MEKVTSGARGSAKTEWMLKMMRFGGRLSSRKNIFRGASFGRHLQRFKFVNGKKYQLHATKGWRAV